MYGERGMGTRPNKSAVQGWEQYYGSIYHSFYLYNVLHVAGCGAPSIIYSSINNISFLYNSTLEGSLLIFWCEESSSNVIIAQCHRNAGSEEVVHDFRGMHI